MSVKAMINELKSYGFDTKPLYEKDDVILALQKARDDQLLPTITATNAMKYDLQNNHSITNIDKYLERKELESAFLQHCTSIRSNIEGIVFHDDLIDGDTTNDDDTCDDDVGNNNVQESKKDDTTKDQNNAIDEARKARTELIQQEMIHCCEKMSIPEMHKELEQQLFVSPFLLLKCCVAIARIDGIIDIPINDNDSSANQKTRLFPTELWKSIKVQDIVAESFIDKADNRKSILLPSYYDRSHQNKADSSDGTTLESRQIRIQEEMKTLDTISMKNLFHELEDTWGISPRCIYVCTIAVLRVLNVMVRHQQTDDALEDPDVRDMVEEAMANPKIDTLLSQAIMKPHIRNMVMEYIKDPQKFRNNETMSNDPTIQQILKNPVWIEQLQQMNIPIDDHTSTSNKS